MTYYFRQTVIDSEEVPRGFCVRCGREGAPDVWAWRADREGRFCSCVHPIPVPELRAVDLETLHAREYSAIVRQVANESFFRTQR